VTCQWAKAKAAKEARDAACPPLTKESDEDAKKKYASCTAKYDRGLALVAAVKASQDAKCPPAKDGAKQEEKDKVTKCLSDFATANAKALTDATKKACGDKYADGETDEAVKTKYDKCALAEATKIQDALIKQHAPADTTDEGGNGLVIGLVVTGVVVCLAVAGGCYWRNKNKTENEGGYKECLVVEQA